MKLIVNDTFTITKDKYQFVLSQQVEGKDKHGNPKESFKTSYHATLRQVSDKIIASGLVSDNVVYSLSELYNKLEQLEQNLTNKLECYLENSNSL